MIIGLTGTHGSGKGTIADILKKKGFLYYRCSDVIRDECDQRGLSQTRENLFNVSKDLVSKYGHGIVALKLLKKISMFGLENNFCIDGIRRIKEVEEFRKVPDFFLISVDAPIEIRYERIIKRKDTTDDTSFEDFKKHEDYEMKNVHGNMQIADCISMADFNIDNGGEVINLKKQLDNIVRKLGDKNGSS